MLLGKGISGVVIHNSGILLLGGVTELSSTTLSISSSSQSHVFSFHFLDF